eukprot:gnl/Dysnectes_brevis/2916_a3573_1217.p1 GENE.gnl/Dysnectes_brevis/2916_a3573_1217~~gnl/Dysnectes_brevis/2916_a3573_1217.p1  ORF type:complete len:194 (-),score=33.68 gnl/Dysnectes_brevis/2916_a3573_1217:40-621(-)
MLEIVFQADNAILSSSLDLQMKRQLLSNGYGQFWANKVEFASEDDSFILTLEEAAHLCFYSSIPTQASLGDGTSIPDIHSLTDTLSEELRRRLDAYIRLRSMHFYPKCGMRFGALFLLYRTPSPAHSHSTHLAFLAPSRAPGTKWARRCVRLSAATGKGCAIITAGGEVLVSRRVDPRRCVRQAHTGKKVTGG